MRLPQTPEAVQVEGFIQSPVTQRLDVSQQVSNAALAIRKGC